MTRRVSPPGGGTPFGTWAMHDHSFDLADIAAIDRPMPVPSLRSHSGFGNCRPAGMEA
jgi:hypothetical protein